MKKEGRRKEREKRGGKEEAKGRGAMKKEERGQCA